MLTKLLASLLGLAFLAVAALGVFPNMLTGPDKLLNFSLAHSVIHFIFGIFLLFGVWLASHPRLVLRMLGLLYIAVAVIGADRIGDKLVELFNGVEATRWLELSLALTLVLLGFMAGSLVNRRPAKAAAPATVEQEKAVAEETTPDKSWSRAEARAPRKNPVEAPEARKESSSKLADRIEDALDQGGTPEDAGNPEPKKNAGTDAANNEAEPVSDKEKRSFSLFGPPKPQPQN